MSHVVKMDLVINDLPTLATAAAELGLEFREGQKTYRWYGRSMADGSTVPGVTPGTCDHALSIPGNTRAYEVGVVTNPDGTFSLHWDSFAGGNGLTNKIGATGEHLKQGYTRHRTLGEARKKGFRLVQSQTTGDGMVQLTLTR